MPKYDRGLGCIRNYGIILKLISLTSQLNNIIYIFPKTYENSHTLLLVYLKTKGKHDFHQHLLNLFANSWLWCCHLAIWQTFCYCFYRYSLNGYCCCYFLCSCGCAAPWALLIDSHLSAKLLDSIKNANWCLFGACFVKAVERQREREWEQERDIWERVSN